MINAEEARDQLDACKEVRQRELYGKIFKEAEYSIGHGIRDERGWSEIPIFDLNEKYTERLAQDFAYNGYDVYMRLALDKRYMVFKWCGSVADLPAGVVLRKKSLERMRDEFEEMEKAWHDELDAYGVYCIRKTRQEKEVEGK